MRRYGKIDIDKVEVGMRIRVTQKYYRDGRDAQVVVEGEVESIGWDRDRKGLIAGTPLPDVVSTIHLWGWTVWRNIGDGWTTTLAEQALPPLPVIPGSVIETEGQRAAVLSFDHMADYDQTVNAWVWADGTPGGPTERELSSARIVYEARRV